MSLPQLVTDLNLYFVSSLHFQRGENKFQHNIKAELLHFSKTTRHQSFVGSLKLLRLLDFSSCQSAVDTVGGSPQCQRCRMAERSSLPQFPASDHTNENLKPPQSHFATPCDQHESAPRHFKRQKLPTH